MEEVNEFSSLSAYIESFRLIIDDEYNYIVNYDWTKVDNSKSMKEGYAVEEDIVSNAVGHLKNMHQYQKAETKLYKKWYGVLIKFFDLHKKRVSYFQNLSLSDLDVQGVFAFRRKVSAELAKMQVIINRTKLIEQENETRLPRIKNDIPISIPMSKVIDKNFPHIREGINKKIQQYVNEGKIVIPKEAKEYFKNIGIEAVR